MVYLKNINYLIYKTNGTNDNTECLETVLMSDSCNGDTNYRDQCDNEPVVSKVIAEKDFNGVTYYSTSIATANCESTCYTFETNINCETYLVNYGGLSTTIKTCATSIANCIGCHDTCLELDCVETYLSRVIDCELKESNNNVLELKDTINDLELTGIDADFDVVETTTADGETLQVIETDSVLTADAIKEIKEQTGETNLNLKYKLTVGTNDIKVVHNLASNTFTTDVDLTEDNTKEYMNTVKNNVEDDADFKVIVNNYIKDDAGVAKGKTELTKSSGTTTLETTDDNGELIESTPADLGKQMDLATNVGADEVKAKVNNVTASISTTANSDGVRPVSVENATSDNVADTLTGLSDGLFIAGEDVTYRINMEDNVNNTDGTAGFQFGDYILPAVDLVIDDEVTTFDIPKLARGSITFNDGTNKIEVTGIYKNGDKSTNKGYLKLVQGTNIKYIGKKSTSTGSGAITEPKLFTDTNSISENNYLDRSKVFQVSNSFLTGLGFLWNQTLGRGFGLGLGSTFGGLDPNPIISVDIGDANNNILAGIETKFKINLSRVSIEKSNIIVSYTDSSGVPEVISDDNKVLNISDKYLEVTLPKLAEDNSNFLDITYIGSMSSSLSQITFKTVNRPTTLSFGNSFTYDSNSVLFYRDNTFKKIGTGSLTNPEYSDSTIFVDFTDEDLKLFGETVLPNMIVKDANDNILTEHPFIFSESADSNSSSGILNYQLTIDPEKRENNLSRYEISFTAVDRLEVLYEFSDSNDDLIKLIMEDAEYDGDGDGIIYDDDDDDDDINNPIDFEEKKVEGKVFKNFNIYNTNLSGIEFRNCDLRGTTFNGCKFNEGSKAQFRFSLLQNARFVDILDQSNIKIQTKTDFEKHIQIPNRMYSISYQLVGNKSIFTVEFRKTTLPTIFIEGTDPINYLEIYNAVLLRSHDYVFGSTSSLTEEEARDKLINEHNLTIKETNYTLSIETNTNVKQTFTGIRRKILPNNTAIPKSQLGNLTNINPPTELKTVTILREDTGGELDTDRAYYIVGDFEQSIKGVVGKVKFVTSSFPKHIVHDSKTYYLGDDGDITTVTLSGTPITLGNGSILMVESPRIIPQTVSLNTYTSLKLRFTFESIRKLTNLSPSIRIERVELFRSTTNITDSTGTVVNSFTLSANNNVSELTLEKNTNVEFDIEVTVYLKDIKNEDGEMSSFSGQITISAKYMKGMGITLGDPHITTVSGATYELPYKVADYRLIQGKDLIVNVSTRRLTTDEGKAIKEFYKKVTKRTPPKSLITSGVFYERVIVFYKSSVINFSFSKNKLQKIGNQIKLLNKHTLRINDAELGEITLKFDYLDNPQEKYGIQLSCSRPEKLSGLLLNEYIAESMMVKGLLDKNHKQGVLGKNKVLSKFFKVKKN